MSHLAVFASSSEEIAADLVAEVDRLAFALAEAGWNLVFGGSDRGLMRVTARAFQRAGREIVSVIPRAFHERGLTFAPSSEVIHTEDLRERKRLMAARAGAFLALPGGPGTTDEFIEILTAKLVGMSQAPLVLFDPGGQWRRLIELFEDMRGGGFAYLEPREHFVHARDAATVLRALPGPGAGSR